MDEVVLSCVISSAITTETSSTEEGWDTEDIEIPDEDLLISDAKTLMDEAKAGNVEELQVPSKVTFNINICSFFSVRSNVL